jgi:hypothetical protein
MTERETLLAEIAEKQARLAELDAEPDYEAWRPALEALMGATSWTDMTRDPLDQTDKAIIRGLIAALPKAPPMGECQPRWPSEDKLRDENQRLREALCRIANGINVQGTPWHDAQLALDRIVTDVKGVARDALQTGEQP